MASRTYVPTLKFLTKQITKFVARYREKIAQNISPEAMALLNSLVELANQLADALPDTVIGD